MIPKSRKIDGILIKDINHRAHADCKEKGISLECRYNWSCSSVRYVGHGGEFALRSDTTKQSAFCEKPSSFLSLCARGCWMITKTSSLELSSWEVEVGYTGRKYNMKLFELVDLHKECMSKK